MVRLVALASAAVLAGCASAPRAPDRPPSTEAAEDIDVLSEEVDCRRIADGAITVEKKCCDDNIRAMGC